MSEIQSANEKRLDLLNRCEFVENFIHVAGILAQNRKNVCYAINGNWGIGKSFVLDMIHEHDALNEFWVFRYNCWEYDYYDEPLVAIVASMLKAIDNQTHVLSEEKQRQFVEIIKIIGKGLWKKGELFIKDKTGIDVERICETVATGCDNAKQQINDDLSFDEYYPLRAALSKFRAEIKALAVDYPVLFIVDEIDRCLPEYAIKVLERLHHIFSNIPNVQVVIAIDKKQIEHTIRQIFGEKTDVDRYLAKFISFELKLPEGSFSNSELYDLRFEEYLSRFTYQYSETAIYDVNEFKNRIFDGLDIRTRIAIIDKCLLLHDLLVDDSNTLDYAFMCIEVFLTIIKSTGVDIDKLRNLTTSGLPFPHVEGRETTSGLSFLAAKFREPNTEYKYFSTQHDQRHVYIGNIWGVIMASYQCILNPKRITMSHGTYSRDEIRKHSIDYWSLLETIC